MTHNEHVEIKGGGKQPDNASGGTNAGNTSASNSDSHLPAHLAGMQTEGRPSGCAHLAEQGHIHEQIGRSPNERNLR